MPARSLLLSLRNLCTGAVRRPREGAACCCCLAALAPPARAGISPGQALPRGELRELIALRASCCGPHLEPSSPQFVNCAAQVMEMLCAFATTMSARTFEEEGGLKGYENLAGKSACISSALGPWLAICADPPAALGMHPRDASQSYWGPACAQLSVRRWTLGQQTAVTLSSSRQSTGRGGGPCRPGSKGCACGSKQVCCSASRKLAVVCMQSF